ncbi:MAG: hypothetical protein Tp172SUR151031_23 [Prokaryotic dsDNA virus sp.]|nr:MAG: hypothetical protein Tp172SUR151031_23 [Prokaryotic dsDNA virus sp.]|tara:strand:+ start:8932 stop:9084 length:153 start_codon:yes stop_codon:yes gene_type:complete
MITIKLTEKEMEMIRIALTSSDYFHLDLSEQGLDEEQAKVMESAIKKFIG